MYEMEKWNHNNLPIIIIFFNRGSIKWRFTPHLHPQGRFIFSPFLFLKVLGKRLHTKGNQYF